MTDRRDGDPPAPDASVTAFDSSAAVDAAPAPASTLAPGAVLAGRYEIHQVLGRGGMGLVVSARDRTLGEEIAIKLLRADLALQRRWAMRLAREVKLARQIQHPNVCRVFDFQQAEGHVFLVMELGVGALRAELAAPGADRRPVDARVADARAVAAGLGAIHRAGIIHRDVTTQNVLRLTDGRLVVSDFGLAVDAGETTASIHGGTTTYMAPEVAAGGPASFASDVWALGIVIHEIVFGARPRWRHGLAGHGMERPTGATATKTADKTARAVFALCRALTAENPAARPPDGDAVLRLFDRVDGARARPPRKPAVVAAVVAGIALAAALVVGAAVGLSRKVGVRAGAGAGAGDAHPAGEGVTPITGTPADWTDVSRVLATVDGTVRCLVTLPDRRTLRFVWGIPPRADDVDARTGARHPSPLVPAAYAEGCPDLSADGRRLIFQGYDGTGRASILQSNHADGSDAVPIAAAADPSMASEPKWLAGGDAFVLDVDQRHIGVFDRQSGRVTVLPGALAATDFTLFHLASGDQVFAVRMKRNRTTEIDAITWPGMATVRRVTVPGWKDHCQTSDGRIFHCHDTGGTLLRIDVTPALPEARRIGVVRDQNLSYSSMVDGGIAFVSNRGGSDAWVRDRGGSGPLRRLTHDGHAREVAACGDGTFLILRRPSAGPRRIERVAADGRVLHTVATGFVMSPACSRSGADWWFGREGSGDHGLHHCTASGCTRVTDNLARGLALSPDETRILFLTTSDRGTHVRWIPAAGGAPREIADTETFCAPGWSGARTVWVSRRRRGVLGWIEFHADTGKETGRVAPAAKSCTGDDDPDPLSPVSPDARIVVNRTSQIRIADIANIAGQP